MLENWKNNGDEEFQAWIEDVDEKQAMTEHKCKEFNDVVSCYIKSTNDKRFRVCVKVDDTDRPLCCDLSIDGQCVSSYFMGKWSSDRIDKGICFEDIDGGPGEIIPLRFGQTQTSGA